MLQLLGLGAAASDPSMMMAPANVLPLTVMVSANPAAQAAPLTAPNVNSLLIRQLQCLLNMAMLSGDASNRFQQWSGGKNPPNWAEASAWVPLAVDGIIKPDGSPGINEAMSIQLLSEAGVIQFRYMPPGFGANYVIANTASYVGAALSYLSAIGYTSDSLATCDFPGQAAIAAATAAQQTSDQAQAAVQAQNAATAAAAQQAALDAQSAADAASQGTAPSPGMMVAPTSTLPGQYTCSDGVTMVSDPSLCPVPATSFLTNTMSIAGYDVPYWALGLAAAAGAWYFLRR